MQPLRVRLLRWASALVLASCSLALAYWFVGPPIPQRSPHPTRWTIETFGANSPTGAIGSWFHEWLGGPSAADRVSVPSEGPQTGRDFSPQSRSAPPSAIETHRRSPVAAVQRLAADAKVVRHYILPDGRAGQTRTLPLPPAWAGLSLGELRAAYPDVEITHFTPTRVEVNARCSVPAGAGFIGIAGDHVAVFEGVPGDCQALLEATPLRVASLPQFLIADLTAGIRFSSRQEMIQILDSMNAGV